MPRYVSRKSRSRRPMARKSTRKSYRKKSYSKGKNGTSGNTVTPQRDMRMQYQKTRMPSGKKRKWLSFVKKVKAVEASGRGLQRLVMNDSILTTWNEEPNVGTGIRPQGVSEINLFSVNSTGQGGRDKDLILDSSSNMRQDQAISAGLSPAVGVDKPTDFVVEISRLKVPIKMAMIDITYTNAGDFSLELDLYVLKHRDLSSPLVTPVTSLIQAQNKYNSDIADKLYYPADASNLNQPFQFVDLDSRGVTPFMTPGLSKFAGATIINKTKVFLAPRASVTRSYNDQKHFYIHSHDGGLPYRYDKDTITYLALAKSTGNLSDNNNTLVTSFTKTYCWTQEGVRMPRASYVPST